MLRGIPADSGREPGKRLRVAGNGDTVKFVQKLKSWFGKKQSPFEELLFSHFGAPSDGGIYVSPETAMRCSAVFACVGLLAESIAQLPMKLYKGYGWERKEAREHWIHRLLYYRPSPWQTSFEWRETAMLHLCLRGNFYAYKVRDGTGRVMELLPLHPDAVSVRQLDNWDLEYRVTFKAGKQMICSQRDIFHVAYRSLDGFTGLSPISYQRETIGLTLAAQKHGAKTFSNGAKPGGVLTHPTQLSDDAARRLRENWETTYGGDNAGKTAILEEGMTFSVVSMSNTDAQYLETRRFQVEDIARIFGIPLFMIQSTEKTTSWGSGIEQMSMGYVRYTLLPWVRRWEQAIRRDLIAEAREPDIEVRFNLEGLQRGDIRSRFQSYQIGVNMGVYSPNEVRELEDMNPREGGDVWLTPMNMRITDDEGVTKINDEDDLPDGGQGSGRDRDV
jgi:HK97 family phage portal protein